MKQVELVRIRLAKGLDTSVRQFLCWLSCTDNAEATDQLRNAISKPDLIAKLTETVMEHLGHSTKVRGVPKNGHEPMSHARRVAAKL